MSFRHLLVQVLLSVLSSEQKGGHVIRRLQQEIQKEAQAANHDVTPITMALMAGFQVKQSVVSSLRLEKA